MDIRYIVPLLSRFDAGSTSPSSVSTVDHASDKAGFIAQQEGNYIAYLIWSTHSLNSTGLIMLRVALNSIRLDHQGRLDRPWSQSINSNIPCPKLFGRRTSQAHNAVLASYVCAMPCEA
jgi:hypothetical protein